jgi:hypothetical protein
MMPIRLCPITGTCAICCDLGSCGQLLHLFLLLLLFFLLLLFLLHLLRLLRRAALLLLHTMLLFVDALQLLWRALLLRLLQLLLHALLRLLHALLLLLLLIHVLVLLLSVLLLLVGGWWRQDTLLAVTVLWILAVTSIPAHLQAVQTVEQTPTQWLRLALSPQSVGCANNAATAVGV